MINLSLNLKKVISKRENYLFNYSIVLTPIANSEKLEQFTGRKVQSGTNKESNKNILQRSLLLKAM